MTGEDTSASTGDGQNWQWDVVLSFAGAQRGYAEQVAVALKARGVRCFYDADEQIDLWGKYLAEELPAIYGERAAAVVVFISAEYAARDWTRLERRAALARAVQERREYVLPARFDDTQLAGLLPDVVSIDLRRYTPAEFAGLVAGKLAALGIWVPAAGSGENLDRDAGGGRPPGAVRVEEADLRRLGVHAAISMPEVPDEVPPEYVPRDTDAARNGLRAKVMAAAERGGFVLLVGGSSVGKTRSAFEAVTALLPDWWLVHPAGPAEVAALASAATARTVVWLDELQRYLDGEHRVTGAVVRALLNAPHPVVIISTLWPDRYTAYTSLPASGGADPHAREREMLDLATVIRIPSAFSPAEQGRARAAAFRDRRVAAAMEAAGYGLTQTLAAAPQLVARWLDAQTASPYAWAVLTAALDAARLGARAPLSAGFLRAAAPGYCTSQQQAEAPQNWFEQALAYATGKLHGAVATLCPSGIGMGQIGGYIAADYLIQHAGWERRSARAPASTWDAFSSHIGDPGDADRLADSAEIRLRYGNAILMYRRAADAGDGHAAWRLAGLLEQRGNPDEAEQMLRAAADVGLEFAAGRLAELLEKRGDLGGLRARADAGDVDAARRLAGLLEQRGNPDEAEQILRTWAEAGDGDAAWQLAELLEKRGNLDEAEQMLRVAANAGHELAIGELVYLLEDLDGSDEAEQMLRAVADAAHEYPTWILLAGLLERRGDLDEAEQMMRDRADAGDLDAAQRLAGMLKERGDLDGLRARADAGDEYATRELIGLMEQRGDLDGLRARAETGDRRAAWHMADLLEKRGDLDEAEQIMHAIIDAGDGGDWGRYGARRLAELLSKQGRAEEAERLRRFGLNPDGSVVSP
jgi:TIR domain